MKSMKKKGDKELILNQPITKEDNDWIGVKTYVDRLDEAINEGAEIVGVTSDFGAGKSSLLSLYKNRCKGDFFKRVYTINMWEVLNIDHENTDERKKTVKDMHKVFLYHMVNQISATKGSYLSKRLSKNYGLISIQSSSVYRSIMVLLAIMSFAVGEAFRRFGDLLVDFLGITDTHGSLIQYIAYLLGIVSLGIVLWKSDFIFSSTKSEGKREDDENIIIDFYLQEVLYKNFFRHYIFVIEDLDRTDDPIIVTEFLKELRKYYLSDNNIKRRFHHNKVTFVVCIKPEALLNTNKDINLYQKFFDYVLNLPEISIDNYDAILNGFLQELKGKLIMLGLISDNSKASIDSIKGMHWIIRGRKLDIRNIKLRLNQALTLYESLYNKFQKKNISFEKCAVVIYLKSEYEGDFYNLSAESVEYLLSQYAKKNMIEDEGTLLAEWGDFSTEFQHEMKLLVENKLIDANYRTYFYNYPKDSNLYDTNEIMVYNAIVYQETPRDKNKFQDILDLVDNKVIYDAFARLHMLDIKFPIFSIEYDQIFAVIANQFEDQLCQMVEEFPHDEKNIKRYKDFVIKCVEDRKGIANRSYLLNELAESINRAIEDKEILVNIRETICLKIPSDVILIQALYDGENPMLTVAEIEAIDDISTIMRVINYATLTTEQEACMAIHERIIKDCVPEDEYVQFYLQVESKQTVKAWYEKMKAYCERHDQIPVGFISRFRVGIEEQAISPSEYISLLENISNHSSEEIELLRDLEWCDGLSESLCKSLYNEEYYREYVCNQIITDDTGIDLGDVQIRDVILEESDWIAKNATKSFSLIRKNVLKEGKFICTYDKLFEAPYPFVSKEELMQIKNYRDAINILSKWTLEDNDLKCIADYFSQEYRKPTDTYEILQYIVSLERPCAYKLFYLLNMKNISYMRMAKKKVNEMNRLFYEKFEMEDSAAEKVKFMKSVNKAIPYMEKELYKDMGTDKDLCEEYVNFINNLSEINEETIENICALKTCYAYSTLINEELYRKKQYKQYVVSKTLGDGEFQFEQDKLPELGDIYKFLFNQSAYTHTIGYMKKNKEFLSWLIQQEAYKELEINIENYHAARQTKELLKYIIDNLQEEKIIEYLSQVNGFDNHESAHFFVQLMIQNRNLLIESTIYDNCHPKLIDPGLKGWYTKAYKAAKND